MKENKQTKIIDLYNTGLKPREIAKKAKCAPTYVYNILAKYKANFTPKVAKPTNDLVNHPSHYKAGGIETIDFIEAKTLDYHLGNVVKYVTRSSLKGNKLQDLQKAQWYLNRAITNLK